MDRMQRVVPNVSTGRAQWIRALPLALAVAGLGLAMGSAAPTVAAQAQASGQYQGYLRNTPAMSQRVSPFLTT